jgi:putative Mn2+ efflux pump MntP
MGRRGRLIQNLQLFAGTVLIGLGILILVGNLASTAAHLSHLLGLTVEAEESFGPFDAAGLAISHALRSYLFDHQEFLRGFQRILISFWPLVLIIAGTIMLRDGFVGKAKELQKKMPGMSISILLVRR